MDKKNSAKIKTTKSLCPVCLKIIPADITEENKKIMLVKTCPRHGPFKDTYWSDSATYEKFSACQAEGKGIKNSNTVREKGCPADCGLCNEHKTNTILANLDVTNRCNQICPVCFANAVSAGYVYEPSYDQIRKMLALLRSQKPVPVSAVQFSGGEPTIRKDLPEIIRLAKKMGFVQVQIATNGARIANSSDYARKLSAAGLNTVYLQFDGTEEKIHRKIRGFNALPNKLKAIENCRAAGLDSVVLVPTIIRGINDDNIGKIIKFAAENRDVVKSINFQPVSFSGRIDRSELIKARITIPDVIKKIEEGTKGAIGQKDFYPIPYINAVSEFINAWEKNSVPFFSIHPHCGAASYIFLDKKEIIPITKFIDAGNFRKLIVEQTKIIRESSSPALAKIKTIREIFKKLPTLIEGRLAPENLNISGLIMDILKNGSKESTVFFHKNILFIGIMHFMDPHNFDVERIKSCGIHYVTPDQKIIPFCSYNILYRKKTEKMFSSALKR